MATHLPSPSPAPPHAVVVQHVHTNWSSPIVCSEVEASDMQNSSWSSWGVPWVCKDVVVASTSFQSLLCYPTWDYSSMQLAVLFTLLFWLRLYARKEFRELHKRAHEAALPVVPPLVPQGDSKDSVQPSQDLESCCMGVPLLPYPRKRPKGEVSPKSRTQKCLTKTRIFIVNLVRRASALTYDIIKRILLQILQWWVVMVAVLLSIMADLFMSMEQLYGVSLKFKKGPHAGIGIVKSESFQAIPDWLVGFSVWSLFGALLVVFSFSLLSIVLQVFTHTSLQVLRCNMFVAGSGMVTLPRDVALQVLLLPMVYSILAAKNVLIMWSNMTNAFPPAVGCYGRDNAERRDLLRESFDTNFALADMYEAWALYCFGSMVAKVLQPDLRKKIRLDVVKAFESLLLIDVSVFVFVCALGADYTIILTWFKWRLGIDVCKRYPFMRSFRQYLAGANWCSSSIAIYNLFTVEHKFGLLNTMVMFSPNLKFWSIKIMVVVAFWMGLVSVVVRDGWNLTDDQSQLLDASFRIYVMAGVSIINLKAWWPWSPWYANVDNEEKFRLCARLSTVEKSKPLTDVGVLHVPPGTVRLVMELFDLEDREAEKARNWSEVEDRIQHLEEAELSRVLHKGSQLGWAVTDRSSTSKRSSRQVMLDLPFPERKDALLRHLQGFYPEF